MVKLLEITILQAVGIVGSLCIGIFAAFSAWFGRFLLDKTEKIIMKQKIEVLEKEILGLKEMQKELDGLNTDVQILKDWRKNEKHQ